MAKKKTKEKVVYVLDNGTTYDVTGGDGKYIFCNGTQFRRNSKRGHITITPIIDEATSKETEG